MQDYETAKALAFAALFYQKVAELVNGRTTLNELRIITEICLNSAKGHPIGVSQMAKDLTLPVSTVSRAVTKYEGIGFLFSVNIDGRQRAIDLTPSIQAGNKEFAGFLLAAIASA